MDSMIDAEESCIYCSKYLYGLNDFNKRMHIETCKVRRLVESSILANHHQSAAAAQHHLQPVSSSSSSCSASSSSSTSSASSGGLVGISGAHHVNNNNNNNSVNQHNQANANTLAIEDYMMLGDNCPYCFKSLKVHKLFFSIT